MQRDSNFSRIVGTGRFAGQYSPADIRVRIRERHDHAPSDSTKIEQLLTEARVISPGAQALLGFQLIVMMMKAFGELPAGAQRIHLVALMSLMLAVVLHSSRPPLFIGWLLRGAIIRACMRWDRAFLGVTVQVQGGDVLPGVGALMTVCRLVGFWYVLPLIVRLRIRAGPARS